MIVLLHLFDLTPGALDFEMAHQTLRAVAIVGREGLPAIDGHAAQGTVGTFAESFVALGLGDDLCERAAHAAQLQLVSYVGHHVGAEGFHLWRGLAADQLLEVAFLEIAF